MKKHFCIAMAAVTLLAASCIDKELYRPSSFPGNISEYFDFMTTSTVKVDVEYGALATGALLEFYAQSPLQANVYGGYNLVGEPVYKIFADSNGSFVGEISLPSFVKTLYIYSPSMNAPMLVKADIENNMVEVNKTISADTKAPTRAEDDEAPYQVYPVAGKDGFYALYSGYDNYGSVRQTMDDRLVSRGNLTSDFYTKLQYILWGNRPSKPSGLNNTKYLKDASVINTTLLPEAVDPSTGEVKTVESAEISFTLVGEAGWYENAVGYYYYKTADGEPANPSLLKKIFILPNISIAYQAPYGVVTNNNFVIDSELAPASINTQVKLLFVDDEGEVHSSFPPGYTIGYFIQPAAFGTGTAHYTSMNFSKPMIYSNNNWNTNARKYFIALQTADGSVVYGCEDGGDNSCEDLLFTISSSPNYAIHKDEELPSIDVEAVKELYSTETTQRTYAFEDIWPDGGDYDLNDVIVEHKRSVTFNQKNYVAKIVDEFTSVQPAGSATYVDAFAVQYKENLRGQISLPENAVDETATGSVIVFSDAKNVRGKTCTVTREFDHSLSNGISKVTFDAENYNPFIISQYEPESQSRTEIHMPKAQATAYADSEKILSGDDAYYINKDRLHPFAITLPILNWSPAAERVSVSEEYPDFDEWVSSKGARKADWYLNKRSAE